MTTLRACGLGVTYGETVVLRDVDLCLQPGTFLAVTGPSGAGKTTLLWALAAALRPATGEVRWGEEVLTSREQAAGVGVVLIPQGNGLVTSLTGAENVSVPLLVLGTPAPQARARVADALDRVGLQEHGNHLVEELSGGQQQRIAIARGLASRASVLLADEPTSDLDAGNREHVVGALAAEAARGAIVVMTTNDLDAAEQADAQVRLASGSLV